jgi:hypothetical protein
MIMYAGLEKTHAAGRSFAVSWEFWCVVATHYVAAFLTVGGTMGSGDAVGKGCGTSIGLEIVLLLAIAVVTWKVSGLKFKQA